MSNPTIRKAASKARATSTAPAPTPATNTTDHVHETSENVSSVTLTPAHPPREDTPEYRAAHQFLVHTKRAGCNVCGVSIDTLSDATRNTYGAKAMETHHYPIERSLVLACDPLKVHADYPQVYDLRTLLGFVDSPANLLVLCDVHHRSVEAGIHHLTPADFAVQKYLRTGYKVAAEARDAAALAATDEQILKAAGIEQQVQDGTLAALEKQADAAPSKPARKRSTSASPKTTRKRTPKAAKAVAAASASAPAA